MILQQVECDVNSTDSNYPKFVSLGDIDRIGIRFSEAPFDVSAIQSVQEYRSFRMQCLKTSLRIVNESQIPPRALVSVRLKRLDSIRRKIDRQGTKFTLGRLDDIIGIRVICDSLNATKELAARIEQSDEIYRVKNYIDNVHGAATGYRGIHYIVKFKQPITLEPERQISVRFEIQVRSFLQHQWAVWSESHGESAKIGKGDLGLISELRSLSAKIAEWESSNPNEGQHRLLCYSGITNLVVAWKPDDLAQPRCDAFGQAYDDAIGWLNYLETKYSTNRQNALLLVGVADPRDAIAVLRITHPLYAARVRLPKDWMPEGI